ncbi:hypothetical protein Tco_1057734 [Tanacetum coccineum]|uniref:Uncharacterized protein n=1 Tax=Tanacetum coccineum TaxID=301880 RepID=A0ABQ5H803_9ASTR
MERKPNVLYFNIPFATKLAMGLTSSSRIHHQKGGSYYSCSFASNSIHLEGTAKPRNDIMMFQQHHENLYLTTRTVGPHETRYCMEDPEQAFVEYASSRTDEAGGLVSNFMASQDARLSKFEADFKQQQVSSARSYPNMNPQCSNHTYGSINTVTIHSEQQSDSYNKKANENEEEEKNSLENIHVNPSTPPDPSVAFITEKVLKFNSFFESLGLVPQSSNTEVICTKGDDGEVMFIEIIRKNDDSREDGPEEEGNTTTEGVGVEHFDMFPTRNELAYHKYLVYGPIPSIFLRNPIITEGCPSNLKIPCNIGHVHYNSLLDLEKEHTKSVYLRNEEDKRRGVECVMSKILGFYKECLELGPEYVTGMDDEGEVTYPAAAATTATVATLKAFFLNGLKYCYCIRILYNLLASLLFVTRLKLRIVTGSTDIKEMDIIKAKTDKAEHEKGRVHKSQE